MILKSHLSCIRGKCLANSLGDVKLDSVLMQKTRASFPHVCHRSLRVISYPATMAKGQEYLRYSFYEICYIHEKLVSA